MLDKYLEVNWSLTSMVNSIAIGVKSENSTQDVLIRKTGWNSHVF